MSEKELWAKAGLKPSGVRYQVFSRGSEGNSPTLLCTDAQNADTVIDRTSYAGLKVCIRLQVLVEGDEVLLNHSSLIPVNPAKCPKQPQGLVEVPEMADCRRRGPEADCRIREGQVRPGPVPSRVQGLEGQSEGIGVGPKSLS